MKKQIILGAIATQPQNPESTLAICHPVEGKGELGNGWNLISPNHASSHIDESLYPDGEYWKHETKDGRHDIYAREGVCPGEQIVDVCDNLEGNQATVPEGFRLEGKNCLENDGEPQQEPTGTTADSDKGEVKSTTSTPVIEAEDEVFVGK